MTVEDDQDNNSDRMVTNIAIISSTSDAMIAETDKRGVVKQRESEESESDDSFYDYDEQDSDESTSEVIDAKFGIMAHGFIKAPSLIKTSPFHAKSAMHPKSMAFVKPMGASFPAAVAFSMAMNPKHSLDNERDDEISGSDASQHPLNESYESMVAFDVVLHDDMSGLMKVKDLSLFGSSSTLSLYDSRLSNEFLDKDSMPHKIPFSPQQFFDGPTSGFALGHGHMFSSHIPWGAHGRPPPGAQGQPPPGCNQIVEILDVSGSFTIIEPVVENIEAHGSLSQTNIGREVYSSVDQWELAMQGPSFSLQISLPENAAPLSVHLYSVDEGQYTLHAINDSVTSELVFENISTPNGDYFLAIGHPGMNENEATSELAFPQLMPSSGPPPPPPPPPVEIYQLTLFGEIEVTEQPNNPNAGIDSQSMSPSMLYVAMDVELEDPYFPPPGSPLNIGYDLMYDGALINSSTIHIEPGASTASISAEIPLSAFPANFSISLLEAVLEDQADSVYFQWPQAEANNNPDPGFCNVYAFNFEDLTGSTISSENNQNECDCFNQGV